MKVKEFQVAYSKKFPTKQYASEFVSLTLKVEIDLEDSTKLKQKVHEAFRKAREIVDDQEWLSRQQSGDSSR